MKLFHKKHKAKSSTVSNAVKNAKQALTLDRMPGYHDLFEETTLTPSLIQSSITEYRDNGKYQELSNVMDLLLDSDDNLQSKLLVRAESLKSATWSFMEQMPKARLDFYDQLLTRFLGGWIDEFIEGKLKGYQFQQITYAIQDGLYVPANLMSYQNLDLRREKRNLVLYDKRSKPVELDEYRFVNILYRRPKLHSILKYYVFYAYALNNWGQFVETYGKPLRLGKYDANADPKEVEVLKSAVKALGTDQAAVVSKNTEIEFQDFAGKYSSKMLYETLCNFVTDRVTMAVLGQTLTTQEGSTGSYAQAKVHDMVRKDILKADLTDLRSYVNVILGYVDAINWGGTGPRVWFDIAAEVNLQERILIDTNIVKLGVPVSEDHFYDTYGIDRPEKGQKVVTPPTGGLPVSSGSPEHSIANSYGLPMSATPTAIDKSLAKMQAEIQACKSLDELKGYDYGWLVADIGDWLAGEVVKGYTSGRQQRRKRNSGLPPIRFEFDEGSAETAAAFRNQSYNIAGVRVGQSYKSMLSQIEAQIQEGEAFQSVLQKARLAGFEPENPYHLRTEYETAVNGAQMAGRWQEMEADADIFPYLRYVTMRDEKVRDEHVILDGTIAAVGDAFWLENYPPNGYNCRCDVEQLTQAEAERDPKYDETKPFYPLPKEFKNNPGITDLLSSGAWEDIVDNALAGMLRNSDSTGAAIILRQEGLSAEWGQIIRDLSNYPVILDEVSLPDGIDIETVASCFMNPAAIWHTALNVTEYSRAQGEAILVCSTLKGRLNSVELRANGTSVKGFKEYGI